MKNWLNKTMRFFSHVTMLSLLLSVACTHQRERLISEEDFKGSEGALSEESTTESTESSDLTVAEPSLETPTEASDEKAIGEDLTALSSEVAPTEPGSEAPADALAEAAPNPLDATAETPIEPATLAETTPADPATATDGLGVPSSTEPTLVDPLANTTEPTTLAVDGPAPTSVSDEPKSAVKSSLPKVPAGAVLRKGQALNRFYFARKGDTAESLSELFYGSKEHAKELVAWNGKSWKAGKIILYVSADRPDDTEMSSLYDEQGIATETYTVKAGDQLSTIAKERFGHVGSWKEIAVVSQVTSPDAITPGQQLKLLPVEMKTIHRDKPVAQVDLAPAAQVAANDTVAPAPVISSAPTTKVLTEQDAEDMLFDGQVAKSNLDMNAGQSLPAPTEMDKAKDTSLAAMEVRKPQSDLLPFALGAGVLVLALFLFLVRRARNRANAEFLD